MKQIDVRIDKEGEVKIEVSGVAGSGCKDLTKGLEKALGVVTSDTAKPEMNQADAYAHNKATREQS